MRRMYLASIFVIALPMLLSLGIRHASAAAAGCSALRAQHPANPGDVMAEMTAMLCDQPSDRGGGAMATAGEEIASPLLHTGCTRHFYNNLGFTWVIIPKQALLARHMCGFDTQG